MLQHLQTRPQRALFVVGFIGLIPWFGGRLLAGLWQVNGIKNYVHYAFIEPVAPWLEQGWWWSHGLQWFDWPTLPALLVIATSFLWPFGPAKVLRWISDPHQ